MCLLDTAFCVLADLNGLAYDLVADAAWVNCRRPSAAEGMKIGAAYSAVGHLNIDVGLWEGSLVWRKIRRRQILLRKRMGHECLSEQGEKLKEKGAVIWKRRSKERI